MRRKNQGADVFHPMARAEMQYKNFTIFPSKCPEEGSPLTVGKPSVCHEAQRHVAPRLSILATRGEPVQPWLIY